uniref:PRA1 family protein n=1 Tax=Steinernema glaseri TaxID=37863 RepID=A0A1I7Z0B8_9BILA
MLFLNSRPVDLEVPRAEDFDDDAKDRKRGITIASVVVYLLLSAILSLVHLPISLICLAVPLVALVHAAVILRRQKSELVWPCVLLGVLGTLVKLSSIIVYLSLFDVFEQPHSKRGVLRARHTEEAIGDHRKFTFFGVLLSVEVAVVVLSSCLQWHLLAFRRCPSPSRKSRL